MLGKKQESGIWLKYHKLSIAEDRQYLKNLQSEVILASTFMYKWASDKAEYDIYLEVSFNITRCKPVKFDMRYTRSSGKDPRLEWKRNPRMAAGRQE